MVAFFLGVHGSFQGASYLAVAYQVASYPCREDPYLVGAFLGEDPSWAFQEDLLGAFLPLMALGEVLLLVHPVSHLGDLALYLGQMMEALAVGAHQLELLFPEVS